MPTKINLIGQTFGNLEVLEETSERKNKSVVWRCKCQLCGNDQVYFSTKQLRSDGVIQCPQCGRHREPQENLRENIVGKKYNHLLVLEKTKEKDKKDNIYINVYVIVIIIGLSIQILHH